MSHDFLRTRCSNLGRRSSTYANVRRSSRNIPRNSKLTMTGIMVILEHPELLFRRVVDSMAGVYAVMTVHVSDLGVALMAVIAPNSRIVVTISHRDRAVCHGGPCSHLERGGIAVGADARVETFLSTSESMCFGSGSRKWLLLCRKQTTRQSDFYPFSGWRNVGPRAWWQGP